MRGAQIQTKEAFLYGRFETMMRPAYGSGIVSSFFTFNDKDFLNNWNEIDFEFLGKNTNLLNTNIIKRVSNKSEFEGKHTLNKRSEDVFWKLCIDWKKDRIIWKVNDVPIRTLVTELTFPQKIMLNIWKSDNIGWAGSFDAGFIPQQAEYKYVRYTDDLAGKSWQDNFQTLDLNRWQIADWKIDSTQFVRENIGLSGNSEGLMRSDTQADTNLILKLTT